MRTPTQANALHRSTQQPEAFVSFYEQNAKAILTYFMRRVMDSELALDLTAETFASAFLSRARFRGQSDAEAVSWLYKIAKRQLSRYLRKGAAERRALAKLGIERPILDDEQHAAIERLAEIHRLRPVLKAQLDKLPSGQSAALRLRVVDDLEYREVAARLNISEQAARTRVCRALATLGRVLEQDPTIKEVLL